MKVFEDANSERIEAERINAANLAAQSVVIVPPPADPALLISVRSVRSAR